jgi:ribose-phosphate pyrophosphokinase
MQDSVILCGTSNTGLAEAIAEILHLRLGASRISRFPDGEVAIEVKESVRDCEVFVVQSTCPPVDENLIELLALIDCCRRASARKVTAIVPYFGYARADKRHGRQEPITASMVAVMMEAVGVDQLITFDLHTPQTEGFFHIPVDTLTAVPELCAALCHYLPPGTVVVSPDEGRVKMAAEYARRLGVGVAVLHKERKNGSETRVKHVVGNVRDRACLIIDDMISTGGTITESIISLIECGARTEITVAATHGLFVQDAREKLSRHEAVRQIFVTDTVPVKRGEWPQLQIVSIAPLIAAAINRCAAKGSQS